MSKDKISSVQSFRPLGAVPVRNEKGEVTMEKVKVDRYVSGRVPKYASNIYSSDEDDSDGGFEIGNRKILPGFNAQRGTMAFTLQKTKLEDTVEDRDSSDSDDDVRMKIRKNKEKITIDEEKLRQDPRMRRLMESKSLNDNDQDLTNRRSHKDEQDRRPIVKPKILKVNRNDDDEDIDELEKDDDGDIIRRRRRNREVIDADADDENNEDENVERRHELLKQRLEKINLEQSAELESAGEEEDEEDEESEYEEYTDSDEEGAMPRLKPIFVSKKDRITIIEKEDEERKRLENIELEKKIATEERRRITLKMIENERRREEEEEATAKANAEEEAIIKGIASIVTDDEDDETAFELWKVRELVRVKRDKEEEEEREKERIEIERLRNMTEEERQAELSANPRIVTNQSKKGKYKFMQKYFHRGVFFLDNEDEVFKRDFAEPTLEDHFDKTVLPSVMQVKNFGRAGRTKYTHLVDQDTTAFDSAWSDKNNTHAIKFINQHGGGFKQTFERPGKRKK